MTDDTQGWQDFFHSWKQALDFKINPAGWPFIMIAAILAAVVLMMSAFFGLIFVGLAVAVALFFRDPNRVTPEIPGAVISPANGRVVLMAENVALPEELTGAVDTSPSFTRISIFLSVLNVHVNRIPVAGSVVSTYYRKGAFLNAALDKASVENECSMTLLRTTAKGRDADVAMVQIAGWIARRIINNLKTGQTVMAGERFGLIRFGSRVDVYLPEGIKPMVAIGQTVLEGETILANLNSDTQNAVTGVVL